MKTQVMLCAIGALAVGANAGTVDMVFVERGAGSNVSADFFGESRDVFAGQLIHSISGFEGAFAPLNGNQITFCTDFPERIIEESTEYDLVDLSQVPVGSHPRVDDLEDVRDDAIRRLFGQADGALDEGSTNDALSTAFQLVLWEIVYDFDGSANSIDIGSGNISFTRLNGDGFSAGILSAVSQFTTAALEGDFLANVIALAADDAQDQLLVPAPGSAAIVALAGLGLARRRR
ncbi:MAG: hypothetical protein AAGI53_02835 [Planctomycetota bacterium]